MKTFYLSAFVLGTLAFSVPANAQEDAPAVAEQSVVGMWGANWSGRANIGASLQTGNTETNAINGDAMLKAEWPGMFDPTHRATVSAEYNREDNDGDLIEDNKMLGGEYDYFFREKWFVNSELSFEQDDIDRLDLRTTLGAGLGYQHYKSDDLNLQYILGPTYLREDYEDSGVTNSLAARWALDYDQKFLDGGVQAFHEHEILLPTNNTEGFLFDSKTGIRLPLKVGLVATGQIEFDWNNDPEPGVVEDDTTYSILIGYEF